MIIFLQFWIKQNYQINKTNVACTRKKFELFKKFETNVKNENN